MSSFKQKIIGYCFDSRMGLPSVSENSKSQEFEESEDAIASERVALKIIVQDDKVEEVIDIMVSSGQTHEVDDALIYVFQVSKSYQIVGGESGDKKILKIN